MSYCRSPHYIYPTFDGVWFNGTVIPNEEINVFLYKILLLGHRDELKERVKEGRRICQNQRLTANDVYVEWLESQEDDLLKQLLGVCADEPPP